MVDRFLLFRPILSAIESPSYKIAKVLVSTMNSIPSNELKIAEEDSFLVMGSLDVNLLFINIPLDETIDICTNTNYSQQDVIEGINKEKLWSLLSLARK